jgi:hypothetical protein
MPLSSSGSAVVSGYEIIERAGVRYAEIIRADAKVPITRFFSLPDSSFQFGLLAHEAGFVEAPHHHHPVERKINDLQQMFVVQRGVIAVGFHETDGKKFHEVTLKQGDAINLMHGVHSIRVIEDMQCVSVKQGPFLGDMLDKVNVGTGNS